MRVIRVSTMGSALAAVAIALPAAAQVKAALGKPDAETTESFTRIGAVRELASGKVLVADPNDKIVQLVDLASGQMMKVGREGNGPGEYAFPMNLIALPDGSTLLQDPLNQRFLIISADGKPGDFVTMPRPSGGGAAGAGGGRVILGGGLSRVQGYDMQGRLYFQGAPFSADGGTLDSVPILRWDRVKPDFDTVAYVRLPANSASASNRAGAFTVRIGAGKIYTPTEAWGVAGDGSVVRITPEPYRVVWFKTRGAAAPGPVVAYTPPKVTEADKNEFIEAQKKNPPTRMVMTVGGGGGGGGGGPRPGAGGGGVNLPNTPPEFNDTRPAFNAGGVQVTADGEVWVPRTRAAGDKIPTYDVFDRTGALVKKVSLNPDSRIVGFGKGTVYVARIDQDDLQYLQRYKRP